MQRFISNSVEETLDIAKEFARGLKGGEVILLEGVLGSGKTVFVKGVAEVLKIDDIITSPSFSVMNIYEGKLRLYHFDLYRIDDLLEIEELLMDYLYLPESVVMIEWGYKAKDILKDYFVITIELEGERRIITIERINNDSIR